MICPFSVFHATDFRLSGLCCWSHAHKHADEHTISFIVYRNHTMFRLSLVLPLVFAGLCCLFTPTTKAQAQDGQRWRQLESQHHVRVSGPHEFTPWFEYDWDSDEEEPSVGGTRFLMTKKDVFKKSAKKTKKENKPKPKPKKKGEKKKAAKKETKGSKSTEGKGEDEDEDEDQPVTLLPSKRFYSSPYDARLFSFSLDDYNVTFLGPFGKKH
jgi:hypothetical protein